MSNPSPTNLPTLGTLTDEDLDTIILALGFWTGANFERERNVASTEQLTRRERVLNRALEIVQKIDQLRRQQEDP